MVSKLIISGPPRSGTTVLAEMIARHEQVALTIENDFAQVVLSLHSAFGKTREHQTYLKLADASTSGPADPEGLSASDDEAGTYDELALQREAGFPDTSRWKKVKTETTEERSERLLAAYFIDATGKPAPAWIGDKMPDVFAKTALAKALEIVGDLHFVYIFRHPLAMIASSMRRRADTQAGKDNWDLFGLDEDITIWLRNWQTCKELIAAGRPVHIVKYEDLVAEPSTTMNKVFEFLAVESLSFDGELYDTPKALQARYLNERDHDYVSQMMSEIIARWDEPIAELIHSAQLPPYLASRGTHLDMVTLQSTQAMALDFGFHSPDDWCRWTEAKAGIKVHLFERERPSRLMIDFAAFDGPEGQGWVEIVINGHCVVQVDPSLCTAERNGCRLSVPLPATGREINITVSNPRYKRADALYSDDTRELGVAIRSMTFT